MTQFLKCFIVNIYIICRSLIHEIHKQNAFFPKHNVYNLQSRKHFAWISSFLPMKYICTQWCVGSIQGFMQYSHLIPSDSRLTVHTISDYSVSQSRLKSVWFKKSSLSSLFCVKNISTTLKETACTPWPKGLGNLYLLPARDWGLQLFPMNEEFPESASHKLEMITSLPFVYTTHHYYWVNDQDLPSGIDSQLLWQQFHFVLSSQPLQHQCARNFRPFSFSFTILWK